jgi:hypothetical protein
VGTNRRASAGLSLLVACGLASAISCAETQHLTGADLPEASSTELRPIQFEDVPAPFGFDLQTGRNQSLTFQHGNMRRGKLLYKGHDAPSRVSAFYRSQMVLPPYGWTALPETSDGGKNVLKFQKQNARSSVSIYTQDIFTYVQVEVDSTDET